MKETSRKAYSLLLLFAMIISIIIPVTSLAKEVTGKVDISGVNVYVDKGAGYYLYIKDGVIQEGAANPIVGNGIKVEYKWGVSANNLNEIDTGDEIIFKLPTGYYNFADSTVEPLKNSQGDILGTVQIIKETIKVVLNEKCVGMQELTDGLVYATGKVIKSGTTEEIPIDDGVSIPPITIDPSGDVDGDTEFTKTDTIYKNGTQLNNQNVIRWDNYLNNGNAAKRFNGESFDTLKNMFFIDELQGPQKFQQLGIKTVFQTATSEGKASALTLATMDLGPLSQPYGNFFIKVEASPDISVDEFKLKLIEEAEKVQKGTWGVIDEKTVVVYFGNIPDKYITVPISKNINQAKEPLDDLLKEGKINQDQYDKTLEHYKSGIEDQIIQFQVTIDAKVDRDTPSQILRNESTLQWSDGTINSNEETVKFQTVGGLVEGIEPKTIKIIKKDDTGKLLQGMKFKIQKLENGTYTDYSAKDELGIIRETDAKGEVEFKKIEIGSYKIVEVDVPKEYGIPIYDPGNTFEIKETDTEGIKFTVINPRIIDIEGTKSWDHGSNPIENQPKEIEVNLLQNGKKVHDNGKTYSKKITAADDWKFKFEGFSENDGNGNPYKYTIEETSLPNYFTHNSETNEDVKNYDIHNKFIEPVVVKLEAKKYLENELSSTEFNFEVKNAAEEVVATGKNDSKGNIKFTGINLPKAGEYKFTINEVKGTDDGFIYDTKIYNAEVAVIFNETAGKLEVTSIHYTDAAGDELSGVSFYNLINTVDVNGTKTWNDDYNQYGKRPSSITINLLANGEKIDSKVITEADGWKWSFTDLPKYDSGNIIIYTITEDKVEYYITEIDGFNVINKYIKPEPSSIELDITKKLFGKALKANQFKFNIQGISENTKDIKEFGLNDAKGKVIFKNLDLTFTEKGVYKYKVFETKGRDNKIKYDDTEYIIEVIVEPDSSNEFELIVKVNEEVQSNKNVIKLGFTNYTADAVIAGDKNK